MSFPDGFFFLVSRFNGKVLEVEQGSKEPAARIITAEHKPEEDPARDQQLWFYQDGFLINKNSDLVLDIERAGGLEGFIERFDHEEHTYQYHKKDLAEADNQRWGYDPAEGFIYQLNKDTVVLDIKKAEVDDGARAIVRVRKPDAEIPATQRWYIRPLDPQVVQDKVGHQHGWFGWMWGSKAKALPTAEDMQDAHHQVYHEHKAHLTHELLAGAAAFEAVKAWEDKQREEGKPTNHALAKEIIASLAAAEMVKLAEEHGVAGDDKEKLQGMAVVAAHNFYDQKHV
ncbi:hypothetical protein BC937DRAFT_86377 [Endogone sp. FLAS-F59071]|nr:hypothetical protein BC937DRAFT_86377 [Endogone sp. FLAS-F59071]|eukprot:RUS20086.1 hypothetical protein BC937DRAFT_86377 [Endogone sp. FLAS-F59071]